MLQIVIERSFDWTLAITAGVGLVGAVIGSAATLAGQWFRDDRQLKRHRTGTLRAVLGELRLNASLIVALLPSGDERGEVSDAAWRRSNHDLAQFLPQDTYIDLVTNYAGLQFARAIVNPGIKTKESKFEGLRPWIELAAELESSLLALDYSAEFREEWSKLPSIKDRFDEKAEEEGSDEDETT